MTLEQLIGFDDSSKQDIETLLWENVERMNLAQSRRRLHTLVSLRSRAGWPKNHYARLGAAIDETRTHIQLLIRENEK